MSENIEPIAWPSIMEQVQPFKTLLETLGTNTPEVSAGDSKNKFFSAMFEDPVMFEKWIDFALETIQRMAVSKKKSRAVSIAQIVIGALPTTRQYFPGKKLVKRQNTEYWLTQIRQLNLQYVGVAKALTIMLAQHGEFSLSRQLFDQMDESLLQSQYEPTTDTITFGLMGQMKRRTIADDMEENPEFAAQQHKKFVEESNASLESPTGEGKPISKVVENHESTEKALEAPVGPPYGPGCCALAEPPNETRGLSVEADEEADPTRLDLID